MKRYVILFFFSLSVICNAQIITPQEKSVLDQWYALQQTNAIDGSWIITNSIPFDRLGTNVQAWIILGSNAWYWVDQNSNTFADIVSRTQNWDEAYNWVSANSNMMIEANFFSFGYTQSFTAGTWDTKTNTVGYTYGQISTTPTSATILVDGWYRIEYSGSYEISTVSTAVEGHLYTNNIENVRIGWSRDSGTASSKQGSYAGNGTIYCTNGTLLTTMVMADKNCNIVWDHFDWNIKKR